MNPMHRFSVFARSAGVGLSATALDLVVLTTLVHGFEIAPRVASAPALAAGVAAQFIGNKVFAFSDRRPAWLTQGALFLGVELLGILANLIVFDWLVSHTPLGVVPSRLLTTSFVYFAICLPLWTRIFAAPIEQPGTR